MSLVSCKYCHKLHKRGTQCSMKPKAKVKRDKDYDKVYNSYRWKKVGGSVLKDNLYMCAICARQKGVVPRQATEVHHITYMTENIEGAYDRDNLLPLCSIHHREIHSNNLNNKNKIEKYFKINLEKEIEI